METLKKLPIVVLISGTGSNLQAIINSAQDNLLPVEIKAVVSSNPLAQGLQRAKQAGIPYLSLPPSAFENKTAYDQALTDLVKANSPKLILLAGFMQILGPIFLNCFKNRILNIHPSLLPKFPGLNTHQLAIKAGATEHGCSIHFVNENLDAGPLIAQAIVKLKPDDNAETLKNRVHKAEHFLYPTVINWFCQQRVILLENQVLLDKIHLPKSGLCFIFKCEI